MSDGKLVRYETKDGVAYMTLDCPKANCYSYDMMREPACGSPGPSRFAEGQGQRAVLLGGRALDRRQDLPGWGLAEEV